MKPKLTEGRSQINKHESFRHTSKMACRNGVEEAMHNEQSGEETNSLALENRSTLSIPLNYIKLHGMELTEVIVKLPF